MQCDPGLDPRTMDYTLHLCGRSNRSSKGSNVRGAAGKRAQVLPLSSKWTCERLYICQEERTVLKLTQNQPPSGEIRTLSEEVKRATAAVDAVTKAPSRIPVSTKLPHAPSAGKTVAWLVPSLGMATKLTSSAEAAARAIGWQLLTIGFDPANPDTVNAAVEQAVDQHVDYVVVLAMPSYLFADGLAKAKAAEIPVVEYAIKTEPDASDRGVIGCFSCSFSSQRVGSTLANFIISDSQGHGHGLFIDLTEQPALHETAEAFAEYLDTNCSGCKGDVMPTSLAAVRAGTVGAQTMAYLEAHPSVNYVVLPADGIADDLPSLLKLAKLDGRVKILSGVAPTIAELQKIADGTIYAALEYPGEPNYWLLMYGLAAHSVGLPQPLQTDAGTDLEFLLRTAGNLPKPVSKWTGVPDYQQQYLDLMGLATSEPR